MDAYIIPRHKVEENVEKLHGDMKNSATWLRIYPDAKYFVVDGDQISSAADSYIEAHAMLSMFDTSGFAREVRIV